MKKIIAFLLCTLMIVCTLGGCMNKTDPGAELNLYMAKPTNFDPAVAYSDQAAAQFLPLIYQGLFNIDSNGKLVKAMCDSYTVKDNVIEFKLKETRWSDGTKVSASDFVYAWKRILGSEFKSEAASLLFYIKNAVEVKNGDISIDNLCLYAAGDQIIQVELIDAAYVDAFLYNCASVALYPVHEDAVRKISLYQPLYEDKVDSKGNPVLAGNDSLTDYSWSTLSTILVSCGPFYVKKTNLYPDDGNPSIILERNRYYYRDTSDTGDDALMKYVTPYRLNIEFISAEDAYAAFQSGTVSELNGEPILYDANLPLSARSTGDNVTDLLATYTYFFNTTNPLFESAEVRRALSSVLDRNEIVSLITYGKPATGLISEGVYYTTRKTSFRSEAGNVLGDTMSVSDAKAVISAAGATTGAITLTIRDNETEEKVAEYVAAKWGELGYTVTVEKLSIRSTSYYEVVGVKKEDNQPDVQALYEKLTRDLFLEKYYSGEFDVIGIQYSMMSVDPFASLAAFASKYSGNAYDFSESADVFDPVVHSTGYNSAEYEELITQCLTTTDATERAKLLVQAEKLLLTDMPVVPLYYMQGGYQASDLLKGYKLRYDGYMDFTNATNKNYKYVEEAVILPTKIWD